MRRPVYCSLILLVALSAGCAPKASPNRSPTAAEDPDRAARAIEEANRIDQEIRKAEEELAKRRASQRKRP